jgi:hypothetical protein
VIKVPRKLQQMAKDALAKHKAAPAITGVYGVKNAQALARGEVSPETVARMHRFFETTQKWYEALTDEQRTFEHNEVVRSWHLNGDYLGRAFAKKHFPELVKAGAVPDDPELALFKMKPDEIYEAFLLGAWQYEYNLESVQKAARFVEDYTRKTGNVLELPRAFGDSARAVANALTRRFHAPSPFDIAKRQLFGESTYLTIATYDPELLRYTPYFKPSEQILNEAAAKYIGTSAVKSTETLAESTVPCARVLTTGDCFDGRYGTICVEAIYTDDTTRWCALRLCNSDRIFFVESELVFEAIQAEDLLDVLTECNSNRVKTLKQIEKVFKDAKLDLSLYKDKGNYYFTGKDAQNMRETFTAVVRLDQLSAEQWVALAKEKMDDAIR